MKKLITILLFLNTIINVMAQPGGNRQNKRPGREKIKALYTAYITQQLNLTQEEAAKFWSIHNEFHVEMIDVNRKEQSELEREEAALEVKKRYNKRFSAIIGNERTNQFFRKDGEFRQKLIDKVNERRGERKNNPNRQEKKSGGRDGLGES
jgi:hypothetical protein